MEFVLLGFDQSDSIRQFRFEGIGADRRRTPVVVSADLTLARQYELQVQNLSLYCRDLLSRSEPGTLATGLITLTAADMAALRMAARSKSEEKKPRRVRPVNSHNVGKAWRRPAFCSA
jgi:hypothetical protein